MTEQKKAPGATGVYEEKDERLNSIGSSIHHNAAPINSVKVDGIHIDQSAELAADIAILPNDITAEQLMKYLPEVDPDRTIPKHFFDPVKIGGQIIRGAWPHRPIDDPADYDKSYIYEYRTAKGVSINETINQIYDGSCALADFVPEPMPEQPKAIPAHRGLIFFKVGEPNEKSHTAAIHCDRESGYAGWIQTEKGAYDYDYPLQVVDWLLYSSTVPEAGTIVERPEDDKTDDDYTYDYVINKPEHEQTGDTYTITLHEYEVHAIPATGWVVCRPMDTTDNPELLERMKAEARDRARIEYEPIRLQREIHEKIEQAKQRASGAKIVHFMDGMKLHIDELIEDTLSARSECVIFADQFEGKTHAVVSMTFAIAAGLPFNGKPTQKGAVLAVVPEDDAGYRRRIYANCIHHGIDPADLVYHVLPGATEITNEKQVEKLILDTISNMPEPPKVIVIDTVARALGSADPNSQMGLYVRGVEAIKRVVGCTVVSIHHTGHADKGRERGGSELKAAADHRFSVSMAKNGVCTMTNLKNKARGTQGDTINMKFTKVLIGEDEKGKELFESVLVPTDEQPEGKKLPKPKADGQRLLDILNESAAEKTGALSDHIIRGATPTTKEKLIQLWIDKGYPRPKYYNGHDDLFKKGYIAEVEGGFILSDYEQPPTVQNTPEVEELEIF
ncbi:AAA family ATPase [Spirochaeta dissipatitropha]